MDGACDAIATARDVAELTQFGKKMVDRGLVSAQAGNISKRIGKGMLISMRGSMLDELEGKIVQVRLDPVVPIVEGPSGTEELGHAAALALKEHRGVLIRGHGVVTKGDSVEEAYAMLAVIEQACHIRYHLALARMLDRHLTDCPR